MKRNFLKKQTISIQKSMLIILIIFLSASSLKAQTYYSSMLSDERLLSLGHTYYANNEFKHAAIYLYAYLQRSPSLLTEDQNFKKSFYATLNYSLVNMDKEKGNDVVGLDSKQDGEDLKPISQEADFYTRMPKPGFPQTQRAVKNQSIQSTGYWTGNDSGTYFITQVGDEVWCFGQSWDSGKSWSNVIHGNIRGDMVYATWADVPFGYATKSGEIVIRILSKTKLQVVKRTGGFRAGELNATE